MYDKLMKEKEMLLKLNSDLEEIEKFLIGNRSVENCETAKEEICLKDTIDNNLQSINSALTITSFLKDTIKGGNN